VNSIRCKIRGASWTRQDRLRLSEAPFAVVCCAQVFVRSVRRFRPKGRADQQGVLDRNHDQEVCLPGSTVQIRVEILPKVFLRRSGQSGRNQSR
jgi:hypothetical protein